MLRTNPNHPEHPTSSTQSVTLYFESVPSQDYHGNSGTLVIWDETYQGHILLVIEADVSELYASKDVTSGLVFATLDSQKLTYEKQYYKDLVGCRLGALHQFAPIQEIAPGVTPLLTLPDPAPEVTIGAAVLAAVSSRDRRNLHSATRDWSTGRDNNVAHLEGAVGYAFDRHDASGDSTFCPCGEWVIADGRVLKANCPQHPEEPVRFLHVFGDLFT